MKTEKLKIQECYSAEEIAVFLKVSKIKILRAFKKLGIVYDKKIVNQYYFNLDKISDIESYLNNKNISVKYYPVKLHEQFYIYESKINNK